MIYFYGPGTTDITDLILPDEDCLIYGAGREQTILNFQRIIGAFTSADRMLEIRDISLMGYGVDRVVRATFGPSQTHLLPHFVMRQARLAGVLELGECWLPTFTDVAITDCAIGVRSIGRLMGLSGTRVHVYPSSDATGIGWLIDAAASEGAHWDLCTVAGGRDGWIIDLPEARPGWTWRGCHGDNSRFNIMGNNASQAIVSAFSGYRRGSGPYNGVNFYGGSSRNKITASIFQNNGSRTDASAIVLGAGATRTTIDSADWQGFDKGLWIQGGADRTRYDNCSSLDTTWAIVNDGTNTSHGSIII